MRSVQPSVVLCWYEECGLLCSSYGQAFDAKRATRRQVPGITTRSRATKLLDPPWMLRGSLSLESDTAPLEPIDDLHVTLTRTIALTLDERVRRFRSTQDGGLVARRVCSCCECVVEN